MTPLQTDSYVSAKLCVGAWIKDLRIGGAELPSVVRAKLLGQLAEASPVEARDGAWELVLPALTSLGVGIFTRTFRLENVRVRVVPYGSC